MNALAAPLNPSVYADASRGLRNLLAAAERGDLEACAAVVEADAARALRIALERLASAAHACAPSIDDIRQGAAHSELRFAADAAQAALSRAAGRATVLPLAQPAPPIASECDRTRCAALLACWRSGQISAQQWLGHLREEPGLADYVALAELGPGVR